MLSQKADELSQKTDALTIQNPVVVCFYYFFKKKSLFKEKLFQGSFQLSQKADKIRWFSNFMSGQNILGR